MTEQEWLKSDDPWLMFRYLTDRPMQPAGEGRQNSRYPSDRKLRLFACACAILAYGFDHATAMGAGKGGYGVWDATGEADLDDPEDTDRSPLSTAQSWAMPQSNQIGVEDNITQAEKAALLREIIRNPFRPVTLPWRCRECGIPCGPPAAGYYCVQCGSDEAGRCRWFTPTVLSLAQAAYEERLGRECERCKGFSTKAPERDRRHMCGECHGIGRTEDGVLDLFRLAVLADALEEAGCPSEVCTIETITAGHSCPVCGDKGFWRAGQEFDHMKKCRHTGCGTVWVPESKYVVNKLHPNPLLAHLRSPGLHVRGCWAIDYILGKE